MARGNFWDKLKKVLLRRHRDIRRFDTELKTAGGEKGRASRGSKIVETKKVVGSVGRWQNLRSDFFYKRGQAITQRFIRIGQAMKQGKTLPSVDLYKIKRRKPGEKEKEGNSEYYVVDGHHRVAMAKKLGQDFLDANVVEYKVDETKAEEKPEAEEGSDSPQDGKPISDSEDSSKDTKPQSK